jgi:tRNA(fMet)-specific endonuclease VapC
MGGKYLLDTNIVIALFAEDAIVINYLSQATQVFIPSIVIGELYYGAYNSRRTEHNLSQFRSFARENTIIPCNELTGQYYGQIKYELKKKGRPIPENDLWIAALGKQYGITLVSRDAHFSNIDELMLETW